VRASDLTRLAALAEDVASIDGGVLANVILQEMADGSGRSVALVDTDQRGLEQRYRISSPAPADAPRWARVFDRWTVEVRTGDSWLELEVDDLDAEPAPASHERGFEAGYSAAIHDARVPGSRAHAELGGVLVSRADAAAAAELVDLLAGIDEGEHIDYDAAVALAERLRAAARAAEVRS